ncbi:MAG: FAD synthetase family protein [Clostridia bacterium]|nr:FAD synthetase family protein [Clostridia bacterium]
MQIVTDGKAYYEKAVLALGMFDGVHIGHRVLLERAKVLARRGGVPLVACTFTGHPLELIAPDRCPPMLTTFEERASLLEELGVDMLFAQPFTEEMRQMPPEVYVGELIRRFHPVDVVCGYNHTFGKGGTGTSAFLAALGDALGFRTQIVPQVTLDGAEVSSSAIRSAISQGDLKTATQLLGRPYDFAGELFCSENNVVLFRRERDGKLGLSEGRYRCILQQNDQPAAVPCVAVVNESNSYRLLLAVKNKSQQAKLIVLTKINKN